MSTENVFFFGKKGITVFESLVVIASLLVIMSIVLPAFSRFREAGRKVACISNLRQYGIAFKLFENDHNYLPMSKESGVAWDYKLDGLGYIDRGSNLRKLRLNCPTYLLDNHSPDRSYAVPRVTFSSPTWAAIKLQSTDIYTPDNTIMIGEVKGNEYEYLDGGNIDKTRHTGGACYCFFDGHATWHSAAEANDGTIKWANTM